MQECHPLIETFDEILRKQTPNLLRLYLNPYVTQTCFCVSRYVQTTWGGGDCQTFLANGFDEALSGAVKLARYSAASAGKPTKGIIFDPDGRLGTFVNAPVLGRGKVEFLPGIDVVGTGKTESDSNEQLGLLVVIAGATDALAEHAEAIQRHVRRCSPIVVICVDRKSLATVRCDSSHILRKLRPDIVVFDESFVDRAVPFSAFTAKKSLYDLWNRPGKTTFHSTTFQPNTISSLHFMRCLEKADPVFHQSLAKELENIRANLNVRRRLFADLYSPSLCRLIRTTGFDKENVRAEGEFVFVEDKRILDAVSGVACSVRGHNPRTYLAEIQALGDQQECQAEVEKRLRDLTGMDCVLPAVSGATAVENGLKIALVAQFPKRHVLVLKQGFGGKTLLSLTGTANPSFKQYIDPLYADVLHVDPFGKDAVSQIEAALEKHPVAVVQVELVQAVGGVRQIPEQIIRYLDANRKRFGYLLLVDEVQTGMYRTGPFTQSGALALRPDLLLLGKGTSDMMFPFALTLYSSELKERLERICPTLPSEIQERYGYEFGYKTVLGVLRYAEKTSLSDRVIKSAELFKRLLSQGLAGCKQVCEVRAHGLLVGIELDAARWPQRWLRKRLFSLYVYAMLTHPRFPVLVGFCQYEPNVLKITPALTTAPEQIEELAATIVDVLRRPFPRLLASVLGGLLASKRSTAGSKKDSRPHHIMSFVRIPFSLFRRSTHEHKHERRDVSADKHVSL